MVPRAQIGTLLLALFSAVAPLDAQAPARPDSATKLPAVNVTANRGASATLTAPIAVNTITAPTLRATSGFGLDEALKNVPGVLAQSRYGTSDVRILIRGFGARGAGDRSNAGTSRGIRVLIDGMPETEPDGRTSFDFVDLATAEAIEVVRSNASSVYGNASGGIVHLLTAPSVSAPNVEIQPVFGSFGMARYVARVAAPLGNGTAFASYTNTTFEGWRAHSDARRVVLNAGVTGTVGDRTRLGIYASGVNNLSHLPGPLTQAQADANPRQANATYATRDERRYNRIVRLGATVEHQLDDQTSFSSTVFASPKYLQRSERGTFRDFTRYHIGGNLFGRTSMMLSPTVTSRLTAGVDEAYQDGAILFYSLTAAGTRGTTLSDNKGEGANNFGAFVQEELRFNDRFSVQAGARYDKIAYYYKSFLPTPPVPSDARTYSRVTPKLGFSWSIDANKAFYANLGGGIEVPAGNETDPTPGAPPALLNALLDPIRSTTYEVGFKSVDAGNQRSAGRFALAYDVALYNTEVTNEIVPYNGGRYYMTAAKARRSGAELGLGATSSSGVFGDIALTLSKNTYKSYVVDSTFLGRPGFSANYSDNDIVGIPSAFANVSLGTEIPGSRGIRVKGEMEYVGTYHADDANVVEIPSYAIFNLTAELRRPIVAANGWGLRGFVSIRNVTDKKYIGSAFLNPDRVNNVPAVFEPGTPRAIVVSVSAGRLR
jgi:iron complex outermembrane receptor protein